MKTRFAVLAVVGLAAAANAQPVEQITYSIEWDLASINAGSNTGAVYANITPAIGTSTAWNTAPGKGQAGKLMAFASSIINVLNDSNGLNGTLSWSVPGNMNLAGKAGDDDGNGGIALSQSGQFGPPANPNPVVTDKVKILDLKWTLNVAGNYTVNYSTKAQSGKVFLDVGLASWVGENAVKVDGKGGFDVTPAPASLALLGLGGLVAGRRRR